MYIKQFICIGTLEIILNPERREKPLFSYKDYFSDIKGYKSDCLSFG